MRCLLVLLAAACGSRGQQAPAPAPAPQNRAATAAPALPDDACLRLARERQPAVRRSESPGRCRLRDDTGAETGRACIATLRHLGREDLEITGCYRERGPQLVLDHATLDRDEAEIVFTFDGTQCWIVGAETWASVAAPIQAFLAQTTGCTTVRDDYVF
ncbi:MAG: hypothetical protein H0X17_00250 [Deltaproteobacteria bacterium]|nr:hypothetical protein [Deltaproteobacteria bacterium]